jgi:hypothetical protein
MSVAPKFSLLKKEVEKITSQFKHERNRHKTRALVLKISSVTLAGTVTVLLGLKLGGEYAQYQIWLQNIALILSAAATVIGAYDAFFIPRALWVNETTTYVRLKDLSRDLCLLGDVQDENVSTETYLEYKQRLEAVLDEDLKQWLKLRSAESKTSNN